MTFMDKQDYIYPNRYERRQPKWRKRSHGQTSPGIEMVPMWYPVRNGTSAGSGKEIRNLLI